MLYIFRTNQLLANILLIFYIVLLRSSPFILGTTDVAIKSQSIFAFELQQHFCGQVWLGYLLANILILIHAVVLNIIAFRFRFTEEHSLFPGVFYILLVSTLPDFMPLSSVLLANTFIIFSLLNLFNAYKKPSAAINIFNTGLLLGLGSLCHFSIMSFVLFAIIAISVLRSGSLKENLMIVIGVFTTYFLVGTIYFLFDSYHLFWNKQIVENIAFIDFKGENTWLSYAERIFFFLLLGLVVLSQGFYAAKKSIQIQKYQTILYWLLIFTATTLLFQKNIGVEQFLLLASGLAIFLSYHFLAIQRQIAEAVHLAWLVGVLLLQYHSVLGFGTIG